MTPLERAARAAKQALIDDPETDAWMDRESDPDGFAIDGIIRLTPVVRAVIEAIRYPSDSMKRAGEYEELPDGDDWDGFWIDPETAGACWERMIDALLAEGER